MEVISYNCPIIILSEDEDDDDVVLVKEEKATHEAGANDDVIFVSESSPPLQKNKSEIHKRIIKKDLGPSSSSAFDTNGDFNISHVNVQIFDSALFSLDSIDEIFQPLDSTESVLLGTDASPASTNTNVTLIDPLQASSSPVPQQEVNTSLDAGIYPSNSGDQLPQSSEKGPLSGAFQENSFLHDTIIQAIDIDIDCIDRTVTLSSEVSASSNDSVDFLKVETPVSGHSQHSKSPVMTYTSDKDPVPSTSNHSSDFHCSVSALDDFKLCIPEKPTSSSNSNSPLPLDVDIFSAEDLMNLFNFFDNPQSEKDLKSCCKLLNATERNDMKGNKISKLIGSDSVTHRISPSVKASALTENSVSLKPTSQDHRNITKCNKQICHVETLSSDGISLDCFKKVTKKSSIISSMKTNKLGVSSDKLSTTKYKHSNRVPNLIDNDNSSYLQSASVSSSHTPVMIPNMSKTNPYRQRAVLNWLAKKHTGNLNHCMKRYDSLVQTYLHKIGRKSLSQDLNTKAPMTSAAHWKIVSTESSRKKRAHFDIRKDEQPKRKQQLLETVDEKPNLKMKLKMISPTSGSVAHTKLSTACSPSNIGLKKSIIRRQASLLGAAGDTMKAMQHTVHRSVSESNMKGGQAGRDTQMLCANCCKAVSSKKLAKCCKGHDICAACLEPQVKVILTGDVKQKNVKCPTDMCTEALSFDELRKSLPSFVVDILEKKLDKEYLSYITKWMFTDEQLKTRSEFATLDTKITPAPTLSMRKYEEIYTQESCDVAADLPAFWAPMEHGASVMAFEVVPDTEEYREIALMFYETCPFGDYDIARIIRVQNPILWKYFALKQSEMIQENDGMDVVVKELYHGTHHSTLEAIARKGFDWRLSGKHGTVYGNGSYFARTAHYSHAYTDSAGSGVSVKAGGRSSYMFQSSTSSLNRYSFNPLRQSSLWSTFPTLQSLNPMSTLSSSQALQSFLSRDTYTTPAHRQASYNQAQPNQPTVKDAACGPAPCTSRSSSFCSQINDFLGRSVKSTGSNCSSNSFSTAASPQNQPANYSSCIRNPPVSTSVFEHMQNTILPALSLWDTLEDALKDKTYDQIKSEPEDHIASCSATVPQCKQKGTANLTSAFARDPNSKTHFMFVAKVLVGRHTGGKSGLKRPPPLDDSNPYGKCYDSCVDNIFSPQVYVIFDSNQAYPEYIIEYNWHKN